MKCLKYGRGIRTTFFICFNAYSVTGFSFSKISSDPSPTVMPTSHENLTIPVPLNGLQRLFLHEDNISAFLSV